MSNWGKFWQENPKLFRKVMEKSTEYVASKLAKNQLIGLDTHLLDFGCGPGYLAHALKGKIATYCGVDISAQFIATAKEKCKDTPSFQFHEFSLEHSVESLTTLRESGKEFNTIIILSVIQYFEKKSDVKVLLQKCRELLGKGGKILLLDVIEHENGLWKDILSILIHSIRNNYFVSFLKFIWVAKLSNYNEIRKNNKLLMLSKEDVKSMAAQLDLEFSVLPSLTTQSSRISYCLVF